MFFICSINVWMTYIKCLGGCGVHPHLTETQYCKIVIGVPFSGIPVAKPLQTQVSILSSFCCSCPFWLSSLYSDSYHSLTGLWWLHPNEPSYILTPPSQFILIAIRLPFIINKHSDTLTLLRFFPILTFAYWVQM